MRVTVLARPRPRGDAIKQKVRTRPKPKSKKQKQLEGLDRAKSGRLAVGALAIVTAAVLWPAVPPGPVQPNMRRISAVVEVKKAKKKARHAQPTQSAVKVAMAAARAQIGKPYRWAAVGPNAFDCSGLMLFAYKKAGIQLPRNSGGQFAALKRVPLDKMKPGDLVFSGWGRINHVGLYIGGGKMIHAPHSGRHVEIAPLHRNVKGAGRPSV